MRYCEKRITVNQKRFNAPQCFRLAENYLNVLETERCLLSQLLPYQPDVKTKDRLIDGLKEFLLLLVSAEEAMKVLARGEFKRFDPLVGENACQIRAVKLALIFKNSSINFIFLINKIKQAQKHVKELLKEADLLKRSDLSLACVLQREGIDVTLNRAENFLIKSYLLTRVKVARPFKLEMPLVKNEYTDTKKIKEISEVGSMFADNLVRGLRERLSESSVKFVQGITPEGWAEMVSEKYAIEYRGLQCIPCFWAMRTLMEQALENEIPIVLVAEQKNENYEVRMQTVIYFQSMSSGYQEMPLSAFDPHQPALVLTGSSLSDLKHDAWKERLLEHSPIDLILAYAATHRQYPDPAQEHLISQLVDDEYEYYKNKAHEWGCSVENPSRFFLAHAYCDKIGNIHT